MKNKFSNFLLFSLMFMTPLNCAEIDTLVEKVKIHQQNFPKGNIKDIEYVKKIVDYMYQIDQEIRQEFIKDLNNKKLKILIEEVNQFHNRKIKEILRIYGWLSISKFGEKADYQLWILVQHSDHDPFFQYDCLSLLEDLVKKGASNKKNYAYLYDRVYLNLPQLGRKQKYGTQITFSENDEISLLPYEGTIENINFYRKKWGLNQQTNTFQRLKKL